MDIKKIKKAEKFSTSVRKQRTIYGCQIQSAIRRAKSNYASKLEEQITTNDTRFIWKRLQNMTNYKKKPHPHT